MPRTPVVDDVENAGSLNDFTHEREVGEWADVALDVPVDPAKWASSTHHISQI
jgi:hypothetical protein